MLQDSRCSEPSTVPSHHFLLGILGLSIAIFMSSLDIAIINIALPYISEQLATPFTRSIWAITSYQLVMAALILPLAILADQLSYRRIFIGGLLIFIIASSGCAFASTIEQLIWARALQGLGTAAMLATNIALIRLLYPQERLGLGLGINAFLLAIGLVTGPIIALIALSYLDWSWLFLMNVPMGILSYCLCQYIPKGKENKLNNVNYLSICLNILMFTSVIYALANFAISTSLKVTLFFLTIGFISAVLLINRDKSHQYPIFPVSLFKNSIFSFSLVTAFFGFVTQGLALIALPFIFYSLQYSKQEISLLIIAWPIMGALTAPIAGMLSNHISSAFLGGIGLLLLSSGLGLIAYFSADIPLYMAILILLFCGIGFGFFLTPNQRMLMSTVPVTKSGISGGMLNISRILGQAVGASLVAVSIHFSSNSIAMMLWLGSIAALLGSFFSFCRLKLYK